MRATQQVVEKKISSYLIPTKVKDIRVKKLKHFIVQKTQNFVHLLVDNVELEKEKKSWVS